MINPPVPSATSKELDLGFLMTLRSLKLTQKKMMLEGFSVFMVRYLWTRVQARRNTYVHYAKLLVKEKQDFCKHYALLLIFSKIGQVAGE